MAARGMRNASNLPSRKGTEAEDGVLLYSKEKNSLSWKATIDRALRRLGKRVSVTVGEAA